MEQGSPSPDSDENKSENAESTAGYSLGSAQVSPSQVFEPPDIEPGTQIGDFLILNKIGPGGWGVVYKALQKSVSREVALKMIRPGKDTQAVIERFKQEKKTLGALSHPNIVNIIAGDTYDGQPYFAMEFVDGCMHITKYADKNNLTIQDRLALFEQVCEAVEYAHEKGVIHRDLKPGNILVTEKLNGDPLVKVIDFGIAKAVNNGLPLAYSTQSGDAIGTLEYMSPEQTGLNSDSVDERSDIYALGGILYELLAGKLPLQLLGTNDEKRKNICEQTPLPPSKRINEKDKAAYFQIARKRGVDPLQLEKLLEGKLDRIVMKCLEKNQNDRYESVGSLSAEIQNCLIQDKSSRFLTLAIMALLVAITVSLIVVMIKNKTEIKKDDVLTHEDISTPDGIIITTLNTLNNK